MKNFLAIKDLVVSLVRQYKMAAKITTNYPIKLDGVKYCKRKENVMLIFHVTNKRTTYNLTINDIVNDKDFINALHPIDALIAGIIISIEKKGFFASDTNILPCITKIKERKCHIKTKPLLSLLTTTYSKNSGSSFLIKCKHLSKTVLLKSHELLKNPIIFYGLPPIQAISIGYSIGESMCKNKSNFYDHK